jgi:hypothetical protein
MERQYADKAGIVIGCEDCRMNESHGDTESANDGSVRTYVTDIVHPVAGGWYFDEPIELTLADGRWQISLRSSQFHVCCPRCS